MSRRQFETYLDKVFDSSQRVEELPEGRHAPQHPWHKVFNAVFLGAAMQIPSLLQIEAECSGGALAKRIGPISDDTIGYALQRQSPEPVLALGCEIARRLKRNGELRTDTQYYHRIVAVVIVSTPFPVPLGIRFQKDGEAEVPCALDLLQDLVDQLGRRFLGLLVGDAIYLQAPFVKTIERLGLHGAFRLKENQPELLREAERLTTGPPATVPSDPKQELRCWHRPEVDGPVADRRVRVVKTVRIDYQQEVTIRQEGEHHKKSKTEVAVESTNFYATNFELGAIPPTFIHQFSRSRWRIDAEVFQTLTTDCHLKHPVVHQSTALVVPTMIRVLAYTLSFGLLPPASPQPCPRPCASFHEFAKRLAYVVALPPDTS